MIEKVRKKGVYRSLAIDRETLSRAMVRGNLVESTVRDCRFDSVRADHSFCGASVSWANCEFTDCSFRGLISPQNRFVQCTFTGCSFAGYQPCETTFLRCVFRNCTFECLKAKANFRNRRLRQKMAGLWDYPEIAVLDEARRSVLIADSVFEQSEFRKSYFEHIIMRGVTWSGVRTIGCDPGNMESDTGIENTIPMDNPYSLYLSEVTEAFAAERPQSLNAIRLLRQLAQSLERRDWVGALLDSGCAGKDIDAAERVADSVLRP